jgi:beta-aspartyl-peptidase (threonine type)
MTLVLVHGGVSGIARDAVPSLSGAVGRAAGARSALDAVELAVRELEDNPRLNAGCGAALNIDGIIELDAGIADGHEGRCGGVANVSVRHPISLARRVLENTPHVLISGVGAVALGADMERLDGPTEEQRRRWEAARAEGRLGPRHYGAPDHVDTVGAVALDRDGRLAAGSSTGGVFGKLAGRVGDSPIFGAGYYASSEAAVVGTGVGELFIETLAAHRTGTLIESGVSPQEACETVIAMLGARTRRGVASAGPQNKGAGWAGPQKSEAAGLLALDHRGRRGAAYNGGSWAVEGPEGPWPAVRLR